MAGTRGTLSSRTVTDKNGCMMILFLLACYLSPFHLVVRESKNPGEDVSDGIFRIYCDCSMGRSDYFEDAQEFVGSARNAVSVFFLMVALTLAFTLAHIWVKIMLVGLGGPCMDGSSQ